LSSDERELKDILEALNTIQSRVNALTGEDDAPVDRAESTVEPSAEADPARAPAAEAPVATAPRPATTSAPETTTAVVTEKQPRPLHRPSFRAAAGSQGLISILRAGIAELSTYNQIKDFPSYFVRLARRTNLRLLLLKRWTSGLQVVLEEGLKLPAEAHRKGADGRAPIPLAKNDIFVAIGNEASIYAGPVPVKHFPLDLTLMLGRGSRDRQIIIVPLPARKHWNTYLYLDAEKESEGVLAATEILAHYALARMHLLNKGEVFRKSKVAAILSEELARRQQRQTVRVQSTNMMTELPGEEADAADPDIFMYPPAADDASAAPDPALPESAPLPEAEAADPEVARWQRAMSNNHVHENAATPDSKRRVYMPDIMLPGEDDFEAETDGPLTAAAPPEVADAPANVTLPASPDDEMSVEVAGLLHEGEALTPEGVLHHSGELPALPRAACHIIAVIDDPRTTATKLEKAIALDQALTAKVLRIANSPFYGAVREIRTVSEAIVRLGFVTIRNWTLVTATKSIFLTPGSGLLFKKIWQQSVLSAMASQLVAQAVGMREPEGVFVGGLMQNIGQLVLARAQPELFHEVLAESADTQQPYHLVERRLLGFDHGDLGALLLKEWNLSRELENAVRWHHRLDDPEATGRRVAAMIALGEEIAACTGTDPEEYPVYWENSEAARFLEISAAQYERLQAQARNLSIDPHFFG